ncbi:hypothetical protein BWI96_19650 [Siphonobacter sp. SORGH_AS_0500]|uniref:hypothetical protein n=1 Tax=Siphonobacter sp. SORGH_AS_0500 TaxID=1864824 RepID=UPI000CCAA996|nr:hypothetical protein [Siphonobacter sp. SORGH_AS_0500]PKK34936.1 hypothetical protein BWI96_19650 [Siphonobacter sp. SORGH_AS_0500]
MKLAFFAFALLFITACQPKNELKGSWELVAAQKIEAGKTTSDDLSGRKMIKILNDTHFSFLNHDLKAGKDSSTAFFAGGGGTYTWQGDQYTEHVEYCSYRPYEGKSFQFTVEFRQDTLIQTGKEEIKELGINHTIVEKYIRVK